MLKFILGLALLAFAGAAHAQSVPAVYHPSTDIVGREQVWYHGSTAAPGACPFGAALPDGCPGANQASTFLVTTYTGFLSGNTSPASSFYAHAAGNGTGGVGGGQTWTGAPHPWTWNSPGVDYPVGYYTPAGSLQDPATATAGSGLGQIPTGCAYQATGNTGANGSGPRIYCNTGTTNPNIQGFDLSLHGGVLVYFSDNVTGTCSVTDNNIKNGSSTDQNPNSYLVQVESGSPCNLNTQFNTVDGNYAGIFQPCTLTATETSTTLAVLSVGTCSSTATLSVGYHVALNGSILTSAGLIATSPCVLVAGAANCTVSGGSTVASPSTFTILDQNIVSSLGPTGTGAITIKYNAFINSTQRPVTSNTCGNIDVEDNYFEGIVMSSVTGIGEHGEVFQNDPPTTCVTLNSETTSWNTVVIPSASPAGEGSGAFQLAGLVNSTTALNAVVTNANVTGNVVVGNLAAISQPPPYNDDTTSALLVEISWSSYVNLTVTSNYVDTAGTLGCVGNVGSGAAFHGSINATTLTVTTVPANNQIWPSVGFAVTAPFTATGITGTHLIEPYGTTDPLTGSPSTGTGKNTGTYILDTSAGTVSAFTNGAQNLSPILNAIVASGNVALGSGGTIDPTKFNVLPGGAGCPL